MPENAQRGFRKIPGKGFLIPGTLILVVAVICSFIFSREDTHIFINRFHSPFMDALMKGWTLLGDGTFILIVIGLFLFVKLRLFFILFAGYAVSGIASQLLKRTIFNGMPRPGKYFEIHNIDHDLYLVPGVDIHSWHAFPSGHTVTAFAVFFGISLFLRSEILQFACLVLAAGVGYSRVYLSQHFLMDVTGGAILGMVMAYLCFRWITIYKNEWMDKPVTRLCK